MAKRWAVALCALVLFLSKGAEAFRKAEADDGKESRFERYAEGFVGVYAEPTNFQRQRVVPGAFNATTDVWRTSGGVRYRGSITPTISTPRSQPEMPLEDPHGRQSCPEMVGPINSAYFCRGPKYGYCDRRSGTCYCETGYAGTSCELCTAAYYRADNGIDCLPRVLCPNDCSGGGACDYATGVCACEPHRIGTDCSRPRCSGIDTMCRECSSANCTRCADGFHLRPHGAGCAACSSTHDPRCTTCDDERCLACGDMLLLSVRRSGRRRADPGLPLDERVRELSIGLPFGTQRTEAFGEAEPFRVMGTATSDSRGQGSAELVHEARTCVQGGRSLGNPSLSANCPRAFCRDARWQCYPAPEHLASHRVCGHEGTLRWSSPTYAVGESEREVRLTVVRSGGGVGEVEVDFDVRLLPVGWGGGSSRADAANAELAAAERTAIVAAGNDASHAAWPHSKRYAFGSASWDDLTATGSYTGSQHLLFPEGVISLSFIIPINDDRLSEGDERFEVVLLNARGGASIGPQRSAIVTILDDDTETGRFDPHSMGTGFTTHANLGGVAGGGRDAYVVSSVVNATRTLRVAVSGADFLAQPLPEGTSGGEEHLLMRLIDRRGYNQSAASPSTWSSGFEGGGAAYGFQGLPLDSFDLHAVARGAEEVSLRSQARIGVLEITTCNHFPTSSTETKSCENGAEGTYSAVRDCSLAATKGTSPCEMSGSTFEGYIVPARAGEYFLEVVHLHSGGMKAEFFNNPWLLPPAVVSRVDAAVDFQWGQNRITPQARDHISARWHGRLNVRPKGGASFTFVVETAPTDNCRLWIDRVLLIDRWNEPCGSVSRAYPLRAYFFHEVTLEYRHHVGPASVSLKFLSEQAGVCPEAPCVIQKEDEYTRMHYETHVRGSPAAITVNPGPPSGGATIAAGRALTNATAGVVADFHVFVRDKGGNNREVLASEDRVHMVAEMVQPSTSDGAAVRAVGGTLTGTVVALGDHSGSHSGDGTRMGGATHWAKYTPTVAGRYLLSVAVVAPSHGMGMFGNDTSSDFPDTIDGLASAHVRGSPFTLDVVPGRTAARACDCFSGSLGVNSLGHGGETIANGAVGSATTFTIRSRDEFRNPTAREGDAFSVMLFNAGSGTVTAGTVVYQGQGLYAASVIPVAAGSNSIVVTLNGVQVADSPYTQLVLPGPTSGTHGTATGSGLRNAVAGFPANFTVQARDNKANPRQVGGNTVTVNVHPIADNTSSLVNDIVAGSCTDNADSTYFCTYVAQGNGPRLLEVLVDGEPIVGSRFELSVGDGLAVGLNTTAVGGGLLGGVAGSVATFVVQMHDAFGNERDGLEATDASSIHIDLQDGVGFTSVFNNNYSATLMGGGKVRVDYIPTKIGLHPLRVVVNEVLTGSSTNPAADVAGSPFTIAVTPAPPSGTKTQATGDGCYVATAGEPAHVFLHVRDMFDNECVNGGDVQYLRVRLRPEAHATTADSFVATIADLQDNHGGYVATYTAVVAGPTWCNATLLQPGGLGAKYFSSHLPATTPNRAGYVAPLLSKVDATISFSREGAVAGSSASAWPPLASLGSGLTYAAVWEGVVRAQHSELYSFYLSTSDGARMWFDGRLLISAWPLSSRMTSSASLRLTAGAFYNVRIEFRRDPRQRPVLEGSDTPSLKLEWSSPSTKRQVVPSAQLYNVAPIDVGGTRLVDVRPATTSPPHSTVTGSGLASALAGVPTRLTFVARDRFGNQRRNGSDLVRAVARRLASTADGALYAGNDASSFVASVVDHNDGSYWVEYTAELAGVYLLSITANANATLAAEAHRDQGAGEVAESLRPFHISGSPFVVKIEDGATSPSASNCTPAASTGPLYHAVAGTEASFVLQLRDAFGNARAGVPADATVSVVAELDAAASVGSADNAAVSTVLTAEVSATAILSATTMGYQTPGVALATGDGRYAVRYTAAVAGVYNLRVMVATSPGGFGNGTFVNVEGSPFNLAVAPALPSAAHSVAFGPGLALSRVFGEGVGGGPPSGTAFNFTVEVRDRFSNPRRTAASETDVVRVVLTGATGKSIMGAAHRFAGTSSSRGQWEIMYPPPSIGSHGTYRVDIEIVAEEDKGVLQLTQWSDAFFGESGVDGGKRSLRVAAPLNSTHAGGAAAPLTTWVPLSAVWTGLLSPPAELPFGDAASVNVHVVVASAASLTSARLTIGGKRVIDVSSGTVTTSDLTAQVLMIGGAPLPLELRVARRSPAPGGTAELAAGLEWDVPDVRVTRRLVPAAALHAATIAIGGSPFKMCSVNQTMDLTDAVAVAEVCATGVESTEGFRVVF